MKSYVLVPVAAFFCMIACNIYAQDESSRVKFLREELEAKELEIASLKKRILELEGASNSKAARKTKITWDGTDKKPSAGQALIVVFAPGASRIDWIDNSLVKGSYGIADSGIAEIYPEKKHTDDGKTGVFTIEVNYENKKVRWTDLFVIGETTSIVFSDNQEIMNALKATQHYNLLTRIDGDVWSRNKRSLEKGNRWLRKISNNIEEKELELLALKMEDYYEKQAAYRKRSDNVGWEGALRGATGDYFGAASGVVDDKRTADSAKSTMNFQKKQTLIEIKANYSKTLTDAGININGFSKK